MKAWIERVAFWCMIVVLGHQGVCAQQQQSFPSVAVAVATLPELSVLNSQVSKVSLADQLKNPYFVGTIFAPINSGLQPLVAALDGDLTKIGSSAQVNDIFSTAILPAKVALEDLEDGQRLTAMNGNEIKVDIKYENGGYVYYINSARITMANIYAGQAVIHEITPILLPSAYQSLFDSMLPPDSTPVVPTAVWVPPTPTPAPPTPAPTPTPTPAPPASTSTGASTGGTTPSSTGGSQAPATGSSSLGSTGSTTNPSAEGSPPSTDTGSAWAGSTPSTPSSPAPTASTTPGSSGSSTTTTTPASSGSAGSNISPSTGSIPNSGTTSTTPSSTKPTTTSTGTTTGSTTTTGGLTSTLKPSTSSSAITAESAKVDPDYGLDISAGRTAVLATAIMVVPLLIAAML